MAQLVPLLAQEKIWQGQTCTCLSWNCTTFPTTSGFQNVQKSTLQGEGCPQSCVALMDNPGHSRLSATVVQMWSLPEAFPKGKKGKFWVTGAWCSIKSCYRLLSSPAVIGLGIEGNAALGDCMVAVLYGLFWSFNLNYSASFLLIK